MLYGVQRHFQQYFSHIVDIVYKVLLVEETGVPRENHRQIEQVQNAILYVLSSRQKSIQLALVKYSVFIKHSDVFKVCLICVLLLVYLVRKVCTCQGWDGVIRRCNSKTQTIQCPKKDKKKTNGQQNPTQIIKIGQHEPHLKKQVESCAP